jgi:hypothetical protein
MLIMVPSKTPISVVVMTGQTRARSCPVNLHRRAGLKIASSSLLRIRIVMTKL